MSSYLSGLRVYASIGAWLAVVASLVAWLATGRAGVSPAIGLTIGLGVLLIAGGVALGATAKTANLSRYHTLSDWIQDLTVAAAGNTATAQRLQAQERLLETSSGPQWITGEGYISVSRSLSELEVNAMDQATVSDMSDQAQLDKLRLTGASVDDRDALLAQLNTSIKDLATAMPPGGPAAVPPAAAVAPAAADAVKQVRTAVNDHRDSSRAGLARLRTHTLDAVALAGTLVYLLVIVATVYSSKRLQLASATALFLVAALVGLIAALNSMSSLTTADDDFGLASARLTANAILSGLAGVGGVVLIYFSGAASTMLEAATSSRTGGTAPAGLLLNDIFDVVNRPSTLVVAALFGATPALLLTGLTKLGDRYATNLTSTRPSGSQKTGS